MILYGYTKIKYKITEIDIATMVAKGITTREIENLLKSNIITILKLIKSTINQSYTLHLR